ncbi:hypothetical protein [Nocardioides sp.]|uniref:hypothetical protein n=1 Tax=Nocardioides sp. TaxID=35761 RepID=UPI002CEDBABC|nr:hypothetical protein [Nocardioides sp.]HXH77400.1 hypothetical protein [Nocardioides sp.]
MAEVPSNATSAPLTNRASVGSPTTDPDSSDDVASATINPAAPVADLVVTKQAITSPVVAGRAVQYVVIVRNDGPSDAASVQLDDPTPASLSSVSATPTAGSCTVTSGRVECALGSLASGRSVRVTIEGQLAAGASGTLTNSATAASSTADPATGNNTGTSTEPITSSADLSVAKSATPVPVLDGDVATYNIVVTNNGPSVARSVTVVDEVPAQLTYLSSSSTQGTCAANGSPTTVTCTVIDLAVGQSVTVTVRAETPSDGSGRGVANTASASSSTPDPVAGNNSETYALPTASQADVALSKTVTPNPVVAGESITYRITARNSGPSAASGVTITDTVASRVTVTGVSSPTPGASCTASSGNDVSCSVGSLDRGQELVVIVTGTVTSGAATGSLTNIASVTSVSPVDPSSDNNSASATTEVVAQADVSVVKDGPATAAAGSQVDWTLQVANTGPSVAAGVRLTDTLPTGVRFVSASSTRAGVTCTVDGGLVTCPVGELTPGAAVSVTVTGELDSGLVGGSTLVNSGGVSSATTDPAPANNSEGHSLTVTESSEVTVVKSAVPATLVPGAEAVYLLDASNAGPSDARDVVVTDTLDGDLTVLEATIEGGTCAVALQTVTCQRALLPDGATARARIRVLVDPNRMASLVNTASVTSTSDPTPHTDAITSAVSPSADLDLIQIASETEIAAGEGVTYTLTVVNNGPSLATATEVTDTLPDGIVPGTATTSAGTCTVVGQAVTCTLGNVAPGTSVVITVTAGTSAATAPGARTNEARVSSAVTDADPSDNTAQTVVNIVTSADVRVTKTADNDAVVPGRTVSWRIVVTNAGPSVAGGVVVTDTVPNFVTITSVVHEDAVPNTCTWSGQDVSCALGDSAPGRQVVTITGTVASGYPTNTLANTARASSTTSDPVTTNNASTATSSISRLSDLEVIQSISTPNPVAGERIRYTISTYNNGPSTALDVEFIVQLPDGLTDVVVNHPRLLGRPAATSCELRQPIDPGTADNPTGPTGFCFGPAFRANLPGRVIGSVDATIAPGFTGSLTSIARISSETIDVDAANNEHAITTQVTARADVSITKSVSPTSPVAGEDVVWTLTATNTGPSVARGVVIRDDVNDAITDLTATASITPDPCDVAPANDVTCSIGDLAPGASVTVTLAGGVPAGFTGDLDNTATITSPTDTLTPGNNEAISSATVQTRADVSIDKTMSPLQPVPGQDVTYTLVVTNTGPSLARAVSVADQVPDALTGVTATTGATPNPCTVGTDNAVACDLGDVSEGSPVTVTITGRLLADHTGDLANTATVSSETADDDTSDNSDSAIGTAAPAADVSATKTMSPAAPVPGEDVTYTVVVTNSGPSVARNVVVRDDVADDLTGLTATTGATPNPCTIEAGNDVTCRLGDLSVAGSGSSVVVTLRGRLSAAFTGTLQNTASVSSPTDSTDGNNLASASGTAAPTADVSISKTLTPAAPVPGEDVTWTVVVTNDGPSVARDVLVTDDVADFLTRLRVSESCTIASDNRVTCALGDMAPGTRTLTITGRVPSDHTGGLDNTALVSSPTDVSGGNNSATAGGILAPMADVAITKTIDAPRPTAGQDVTWTVTVTNTGPSVARDVTVTDDVVDDIVGLTASAPCTVAPGNVVTCGLGDLAVGATSTLTITGTVPASFSGPLDNTATAASTTDRTPGNNTATARASVAPAVVLDVQMSASPDVAEPGDRITYRIVVTNDGAAAAPDVRVVDVLAEDLTAVSARVVDGQGDVTMTPRRVTVDSASMSPSAEMVILLVAQIDGDADGLIRNVVVASSHAGRAPEVRVKDGATVEVLGEQSGGGSSGGGSGGGAEGGGADVGGAQGGDADAGVLPDTGLPTGVVPMAALSVVLLLAGVLMLRRGRLSGAQRPGLRG